MAQLLYLTNGFGTPDEPNAGAAARHFHHAQALAAAGHDVTVITANATTVGTQTTTRERQVGQMRVIYADVGTSPDKSVLSRLGYFLRFARAGVRAAMRQTGPIDGVVASSPSLFVALQGWIIARRKRAKLIIDVRDLWADAVETVPFLTKPWQRPLRTALIGLNRWLERFAYRRADLLFGSSRNQVAFIRSVVRADVPVAHAPNGFDPDLAHIAVQSPAPDFLTDLRRCFAHIVLFAGKHTSYTDLDNVLNAEPHLPDDIAVVLLGGGYTKAGLQARVAAEGLRRIIFHDPVSKTEALRFMAHSDVLLINYSDEPAWSKTVPGKFYDYLYFNKPVVAAALPGEMTELMAQAGTAFVAPPGDAAALAAMLQRAATASVQTRDYLVAHFDRSDHAMRFADKIGEIVAPERTNRPTT